ncbi:hypothetical protein R3W88_004311 [Solanum pinnatisectum]|uniref:Transcription repressor n=1 Tax=Solanum pinnatisectum TaxID=50273 RepID=A0AAV9KA84_9SOLN|nr:hypothetical protein R3W88_004311 [Solanum pinnatisectum]
MLCRLPHCGNLRTLSIRDENNHNIFNSQRFYNNVDDDMVDEVIESLKIEKYRFFVEAGEKTNSIFDLSSSKLSKWRTSSKRLEFVPFNDSCIITPMDSIDAYGETSRSILEGSSSRLSKSANNSTSSKRLGYLPSNDSMEAYGDQETSSFLKGQRVIVVIVVTGSCTMDPYEDIKKFLIRMVDKNLVIGDWEASLEVLCAWLLEINEKNIHKYIVGAFCDLWMSYSGTSTTNTPFGFSSSKPPSPYFMSLIEDKAIR